MSPGGAGFLPPSGADSELNDQVFFGRKQLLHCRVFVETLGGEALCPSAQLMLGGFHRDVLDLVLGLFRLGQFDVQNALLEFSRYARFVNVDGNRQ